MATSTFVYDDEDRLTSLTHAQNSTTLAFYNWTFDDVGRITQFNSTDGSSDYTYDSAGQLTAADHDFQDDENYVYDDNGNRESATNSSGTSSYGTGDHNQLATDGVFNYEYDAEGNRARRVRISTDPAEDYETLYEWDALNRLLSIAHKDEQGNLTSKANYTYDVFHRRIGKQLDTDGDGIVDEGKTYVYDQEHIVLVLDETGSLANRYLHGPEIDQVLADEQFTAGLFDRLVWPLTDHLGTVRDLAQWNDSTGDAEIVAHRTYDSFGRMTSEENPTDPGNLAAAVDHIFGHTGREFDRESNLNYHRRRYLDLETGTWISLDPKGFAAGDVNLYRNVSNDPLNFTDPDGLESLGILLGSRESLLKTGVKESVLDAYESQGFKYASTPSDMVSLLGFKSVNIQNTHWTIDGVPSELGVIITGTGSDKTWYGFTLQQKTYRTEYKDYSIMDPFSGIVTQSSVPVVKETGEKTLVGYLLHDSKEEAIRNYKDMTLMTVLPSYIRGFEVASGLMSLPGAVPTVKIPSAPSSTPSFGVDPATRAADEAAGVLVNGRYIKNPTAKSLNSLLTESGKIGGKQMSGRYMYVIDDAGRITIGTRARNVPGFEQFNGLPHPSLIGGPSPTVRGAGIVDIRGGRIISIDNASGHFKPGTGSLDAAREAFGKLPDSAFHRNFEGYLPYNP